MTLNLKLAKIMNMVAADIGTWDATRVQAVMAGISGAAKTVGGGVMSKILAIAKTLNATALEGLEASLHNAADVDIKNPQTYPALDNNEDDSLLHFAIGITTWMKHDPENVPNYEKLLAACGCKPIYTIGTRGELDGRYMETEDETDLWPGDPVIFVTSGWKFGTRVMWKAIVRPAV